MPGPALVATGMTACSHVDYASVQNLEITIEESGQICLGRRFSRHAVCFRLRQYSAWRCRQHSSRSGCKLASRLSCRFSQSPLDPFTQALLAGKIYSISYLTCEVYMLHVPKSFWYIYLLVGTLQDACEHIHAHTHNIPYPHSSSCAWECWLLHIAQGLIFPDLSRYSKHSTWCGQCTWKDASCSWCPTCTRPESRKKESSKSKMHTPCIS